MEWRKNWSKIIFGLVPPPPKKIGGIHKNFVKNEKDQSCSKLPEMARTFVENDFWRVSNKYFGTFISSPQA